MFRRKPVNNNANLKLPSRVTVNPLASPGGSPGRANAVPPVPPKFGGFWQAAYSSLAQDPNPEKRALIERYEKILSEAIANSTPHNQNSPALAHLTPVQQLSQLLTVKLRDLEDSRWRIQLGKSSIEIQTQVKRIVSAIIFLRDSGISSAANAEPHANLAWAGICLFLPLLSNPLDQESALIEGLDAVSSLLCRFTVVERIYTRGKAAASPSSTIQDVRDLRQSFETKMVELYSQVIQFQARVAIQASRNTIARYARDVIKADDWAVMLRNIRGYEMTCERIIQVLDKDAYFSSISHLGQRLEEIQGNTFTLRTIAETTLAEVQAGRAELKGSQEGAESELCLQSLYKCEYGDHMLRNPVRVPGTCEWFTAHPQYRDWYKSPQSDLLWVSADPGRGKSVLARFLAEVELDSAKQDSRTTCYFFFKDDNEDQKSAINAMASLLHQLFARRQSLIKYAMPQFKARGKRFPDSLRDLWNIFLAAASDPEAPEILCVLDALDECDDVSRHQVIDHLVSFYKENVLGPPSTMRVKFIVTSRAYHDIERRFRQLTHLVPTIRLAAETESEQIGQEIDIVIDYRLENLKIMLNLDDDKIALLSRKLKSFEHRTYLWLKLILEIIENSFSVTHQSIESVIATIPGSVYQAYDAMLARSIDYAKTRKLLQIVVAARRPLTVLEMNFALEIEEGFSEVSQLNLEPEESFSSTVKQLCGLFVTVLDSRIYLIHQTAKEFLFWNWRDSNLENPSLCPQLQLPLDMEQSDWILAQICLLYLCADEAERRKLYQANQTDLMNGRFPFLSYSASNWNQHLQTAALPTPMKCFRDLAIRASDITSEIFAVWWGFFHAKRDRRLVQAETITPAHQILLLACLELDGAARLLIEDKDSGVDIECKDDKYRTPLSWAASNAQNSLIRSLLSKGAYVDAMDSAGRTPLAWAAESGHAETIKLLMEGGADRNAKDQRDLTPLDHALWFLGRDVRIDEVIPLLADKDTEILPMVRQRLLDEKSGRAIRVLLECNVTSIASNASFLSLARQLGDSKLNNAIDSGELEAQSHDQLGTLTNWDGINESFLADHCSPLPVNARDFLDSSETWVADVRKQSRVQPKRVLGDLTTFASVAPARFTSIAWADNSMEESLKTKRFMVGDLIRLTVGIGGDRPERPSGDLVRHNYSDLIHVLLLSDRYNGIVDTTKEMLLEIFQPWIENEPMSLLVRPCVVMEGLFELE